MSQTTTVKLEDQLLFLSAVLGAASTFFTSTTHTIFGMSPFLLAITAGAIAKALLSLHDLKNYADWILFLTAFLGALSTGLSQNPAYVTYGLIVGILLKSVIALKGGIAIENVFSAIAVLLAGYGQLAGNADLVNLGLFLAAVAKSLPSIGRAYAPTTAPPASPPSG